MHRARSIRSIHGRGFSVLEVIVAIAIISLTVGMIGTLTGFTAKTVERDAVHTAAAEAGHRLILQYIEDPADLKRQAERALPVRVGERLFRFTIEEQILQIDVETVFDPEAGPQVASETANTGNLLQNLENRLRTFRVNVYSIDTAGGYEPNELILSLERTYDFLDDENLIDVLRREFGETIDRQGTQ